MKNNAMGISSDYHWLNLTPEPGNFMFGYYDRNPWDDKCERHLALKIPQQERLPLAGEIAEVGFVSVRDKKFVKIAETRAWCHQQGAMSLWLKHIPDAFIFNDYIPADSLLCTRIFNLDGKEIGRYKKAIYSISPNGLFAASVNIGRIPRRGYSYADVPLNNEPLLPNPDEEGVFIIDLQSGHIKMLASYRRLLENHPFPYSADGMYVWLDHAIFNPDSSKVMFLLRECRDKYNPWPWRTHLFTVNIDGSNLKCLLPDVFWRGGAISHHMWGRTPSEIIIDANWFGEEHQYVVINEDTASLQAVKISDGLGPMGHLIFSPDGKYLAADTYPGANGIQRLGLVRLSSGEIIEIGHFQHASGVPTDLRCDLHPRWSGNGKYLTVDSIHSGPRKIYLFDMDNLD